MRYSMHDAQCMIHNAGFMMQDSRFYIQYPIKTPRPRHPDGCCGRGRFNGDLRGDVMRSAPWRLLRFEGYIVGAGMHELKFESARQTFVKCVRRLEAAGMCFSGIEFGGGTEFFHTH